MWHKVVFVEELGTFGSFRDQSLRLADVTDDYATDIVVELLSCQLKLIVSSKLFLPQLG